MKATKYQAFRFTVSGSGNFPIDMLRYDRCVPYDQSDTFAMVAQREQPRTVHMIGYAPVGQKPEPTPARWESFDWRVIPGSIKLVTP